LIDEKDMCSVLTTVNVPANTSVTTLREKLREKSIIIYAGKGCFKNKVFQVGNIGELSFADIQFFLDSMKEILFGVESADDNIISINRRNGNTASVNDGLLSDAQTTEVSV